MLVRAFVHFVCACVCVCAYVCVRTRVHVCVLVTCSFARRESFVVPRVKVLRRCTQGRGRRSTEHLTAGGGGGESERERGRERGEES